MKTSEITVRKGYIKLFGDVYSISENGWLIPMPGMKGMGTYCDPVVGMLESTEKLIEMDRMAGKEDQIDHLRLNGRTVALAYLEGVIPQPVFDNMVQKEDCILISLSLCGKDYPVRVYPDGVMETGTYTKDGIIV